MAAAPIPEPVRPRRPDADVAPLTVLALAWLAAIVATSVTLWLLVGVVGNF
ncbi:MAG TPA: hypothetical protein VM933_10910 [Acidimicrobiales bacterium]|nr:hypothetical protein [Acidimicrobiales bacterium]